MMTYRCPFAGLRTGPPMMVGTVHDDPACAAQAASQAALQQCGSNSQTTWQQVTSLHPGPALATKQDWELPHWALAAEAIRDAAQAVPSAEGERMKWWAVGLAFERRRMMRAPFFETDR